MKNQKLKALLSRKALPGAASSDVTILNNDEIVLAMGGTASGCGADCPSLTSCGSYANCGGKCSVDVSCPILK
jgi:hypothetical protein